VIHYHVGPLGEPRESHAFFYGRHALISLQKTEELEVIAEVCKSFVFDNGAFSVWKHGKKLNIEKYYKWVDDWRRHPGFDWALIPDVIEGSEEENDKMIDDWPFEEGMPVWHFNESLSRLHRLATEWSRISLGSTSGMTPGTSKFWTRMAQVMDKLCDKQGRPICKLHGLRMLDPEIFKYIPLSSADSKTAVMKSFMPKKDFGVLAPKRRSQRANVVADRIESCNSAAIWNPNQTITVQQELKLCGQ